MTTFSRKGQAPRRKDILTHSSVRPGGSVSSIFNALKSDTGPVLTLDEMSAIAAKGWAGER